ncbi:MAG: serine/threonine protein kinase, partial [Candidatus Obscuribacterales bacterium]|nr:serine/threonine protein kinase [Candidatus Obscuribacterales bacterium]
MSNDSHCPICLSPRKAASQGSLTQWIVACACESGDSQEAESHFINMCRACSKRIAEGRAGSFTQFIFRWDICQCETPRSYAIDVDKTLSSEAEAYEFVEGEAESETDEVEINFEPGLFPQKRYQPLRQLGSGGGGSVYLARDMLLNKLVAVKLLHVLDSRQLVAFQDEARATSKLVHPCIVSVLDFGVTEASVPYMVLEYVPGVSLQEVIARRGALDWEVCRKIFALVFDGISFAHDHQVFHRDITPANILLVELVENEDESEKGQFEVRL